MAYLPYEDRGQGEQPDRASSEPFDEPGIRMFGCLAQLDRDLQPETVVAVISRESVSKRNPTPKSRDRR